MPSTSSAQLATFSSLGFNSDENYRKLVALKDKYDPANVFRFNHNIAPSRGAAKT